jgi:hypothetical protein
VLVAHHRLLDGVFGQPSSRIVPDGLQERPARLLPDRLGNDQSLSLELGKSPRHLGGVTLGEDDGVGGRRLPTTGEHRQAPE